MKLNRELLRLSWKGWISGDIEPVGPAWLQWLWTLLFALGLALGFTLLGFTFNARGQDWFNLNSWLHWYRINLTVTLTISVIIHLLFSLLIPLVGRPRIRRFSPWQRLGFFMGVPLSGLAVGWPLGVWFVSSEARGWVRFDSPGGLAGSAMLALAISFVFFMYFNAKAQQAVAEKRASEAQLRLLQGQIEPHFLFNTLANVLGLMDHDTPKARQMLQAFTEYLRASLATLRHDRSPLGQELALADHYLRLLGTRMEDRLRYTITADEAVRRQPLPPLLLQPLVENAVQHGLEPSIEGGQVQISARLHGEQLVIEVRDDGLGLHAPPRLGARQGAGMALNNIRQRLQAHYGSSATLEVSAANPGTLARLTLPVEPPATEGPAAA
jgi:hypothetical protein